MIRNRGFGQVPANQQGSVPPGWVDIPGCFLGTQADYQIYLANGGCQSNPPATPAKVTSGQYGNLTCTFNSATGLSECHAVASAPPPPVAASPAAQPLPTPTPVSVLSPNTQVQERAQWYVGPIENDDLTPGLQLPNQQIQTDSDAPFRLTAIALYVCALDDTGIGAQGNIGVTVRFYRPDGTTSVQKHILSAQAVNPFDAAATSGAGGQTAPYFSFATPVYPNILYPAGSVITFDYAALPGVITQDVSVVFIGTKLGSPGQFWNGGYPQNFRTRPFFGYAIQMPTLNLENAPLLDQPLTINRDADFVLQTAVQTSYQAAPDLTPVASRRGLSLKFKDWLGKYYMNDYVPLELIVGGFDYSQTPGIIYPEIYIPKTQALYFDLQAESVIAPTNPILTFRFGGMKVYS